MRKPRVFEVFVLLGLAAIAWVVLAISDRRKETSPRAECQSRLKYLGLAMMQYVQDYDERYPPPPRRARLASGAFGWADAVQPYARSEDILRCPLVEVERPNKPTGLHYTDTFWNANLAGRALKAVDDPASFIALGEGNDGHDRTDARYAHRVVPIAWFLASGSPLTRHLEGANFAFADGHVKFLRPDQLRARRHGFGLRERR